MMINNLSKVCDEQTVGQMDRQTTDTQTDRRTDRRTDGPNGVPVNDDKFPHAVSAISIYRQSLLLCCAFHELEVSTMLDLQGCQSFHEFFPN